MRIIEDFEQKLVSGGSETTVDEVVIVGRRRRQETNAEIIAQSAQAAFERVVQLWNFVTDLAAQQGKHASTEPDPQPKVPQPSCAPGTYHTNVSSTTTSADMSIISRFGGGSADQSTNTLTYNCVPYPTQ